MEVVENELRNYRLRKSPQEQMKHFGDVIKKSTLMFVLKGENRSEQPDKTTFSIREQEKEMFLRSSVNGFLDDKSTDDSEVLTSSDEVHNVSIKSINSEGQFLKYSLYLVYIAFWATLYKIAIEMQFGIVFLMFSALGGIYVNTRTGPKKSKEISAYSVFNKNCESIDGTLKVEQLEREFGIT